MIKHLQLTRSLIIFLIALYGCHRADQTLESPLISIQIQDRNGLTETISIPDRLETFEKLDFLSSQPYKKVLRVFKKEGKSAGIITTYHPNGLPWQYLEVQDMRALGAYKEWHQNGKLRIEASVIGGTADIIPNAQKDWLFDGEAKILDDQGRLQAQISYQKGMLEGISIYFYPNGQIQKRSPYRQNRLEGEELEFYQDGQLFSKTAYRMGIKNGESLGFWPKNQNRWIEVYQEGLLLKGQYFSTDGSILSEVNEGFGFQSIFQDSNVSHMVEYRRGSAEGLVKKFSPNGELKTAYRIKNTLKQGEEMEYYSQREKEDGTQEFLPKLSIPWENNAINGIVKTWYPNGKLRSQKEYSRNKKNGSSLAWYKDGGLMYMEEYEEDTLVSGQYYKKNQKEPISTISNGNGTATLYDEQGMLSRKVQYIKGKPIDPES
jgi:antitoxin component YwqK of YwqJK toxin-antitoxin module